MVADGTQFLGTTDFNFYESGLDVLGASAYKWLLAGYGNGFFMIKEEAQTKIFPKTIGFNSADATFGNREEIPFIKLFEPGHQDTLNYGSLQHSIQWLEEMGKNNIESKLNDLVSTAKLKFTD